jgi:hypothetical protein
VTTTLSAPVLPGPIETQRVTPQAEVDAAEKSVVAPEAKGAPGADAEKPGSKAPGIDPAESPQDPAKSEGKPGDGAKDPAKDSQAGK